MQQYIFILQNRWVLTGYFYTPYQTLAISVEIPKLSVFP